MFHYKEVNPEITINNIIEFFKDKKEFNLVLIKNSYNPFSKTYWCVLELYYKNRLFLTSNGKGITEKLSLASGYSEMFERYCSNIKIYNNALLYYYFLKGYNNKNYNYNINLNFKIFQNFLNNRINDLNNQIKIFDYYLYPYEYTSINNIKQKEYFSMPLIYHINGSTGLAAGNTLDEAFVQGISEICERYILGQLFFNNQSIYYQLNKSNLPNNFQDIIRSIEKQQNKVFIYDLSYNFYFPVCLVVIINLIDNTLAYRLGSHPIFTIALERCFTELYQGVDNDKILLSSQYIPFRNINNKEQVVYDSYHSSYLTQTFNENLLLNFEIKDYFQNDYFLTDNQQYNNHELLEYYIKLFNNQNINLFYKQLSPMDYDKMYVVHLFAPTLDMHITNNNIKNKEKNINSALQLLDFGIDLINNKNKNNYFNLMTCEISDYSQYFFSDIFKIFSNKKQAIYPTFYLLKIMLINNKKLPINLNDYDTPYSTKINEFIFVRNLIQNQNYTELEIQKIIDIFQLNIPSEYLTNIFNNNYIILYIIKDILLKEYSIIDSNDFIQHLV